MAMNWTLLPPWFAHPAALLLLALLPVLGVVAAFARWRRRRALAVLGSTPTLAPATLARRGLRRLRGLCLACGLGLLIVGVAGPQWGRDPDQALMPGRDLVIVLDMSRSMLAEDVLGTSAPNRLGRAKDALADLVATVRRRGGHRLALVVFAARARLVCPLTHDYDHVRDALARLDPADLYPLIGPSAEAASGTRMGEALARAVQASDPRFRGYQDILLISDGDDPAGDEEWRAGAKWARDAGIPVHTVGVGDPEADSLIPVPGGFLQYGGRPVRTRLYEPPLEEIARLTRGSYIPARTKALPLGELFRDRMDARPGHENTEDVLPLYRQRYPWFLATAFLLLGSGMVLGQGLRPRTGQPALAARSEGGR
jgi:Ca-activated chloride channel family protein